MFHYYQRGIYHTTFYGQRKRRTLVPLTPPRELYASMDGASGQDLRFVTPRDVYADWPGHSEPDKSLIIQWPGEIFAPIQATGSLDAYAQYTPRPGQTRSIYGDVRGSSDDFAGQDPPPEGVPADVYLLIEAGITSVTMPGDFNAADNRVICYGGGGGGGSSAANGGAGGGACSWSDNINVGPGQVVGVQVGNGGTTGTTNNSAQNGRATYFNGTYYDETTFATDASVAAQGGRGKNGGTAGAAGGLAANGVGTTKYSGGSGGAGQSGNQGGGGGGGAGHAGNGANGVFRAGGAGGATNGGAGGTAGTISAAPGVGGNGSAFNITLRWNGTSWVAYSGTVGAGGGGGGHTSGGGGAAGGKFGGGGGSKRYNGELSGRGGDGGIVIRYKPIRPGYSKGYTSA